MMEANANYKLADVMSGKAFTAQPGNNFSFFK